MIQKNENGKLDVAILFLPINSLILLYKKATYNIGGFLQDKYLVYLYINEALIFYVYIHLQVHHFDEVRKHIHRRFFVENS